jgi:exosortase
LILRIAALLVAIGFFPLLFEHLWGLLAKPHYQFIVLLPVAVWLLMGDRDSEDKSEWAGGWLALAGLLAGLAGLAYAARVWSPFIAAVSALVCCPSVLWMLGGPATVQRWAPAWIMSWIAIPLPYGWDEDLIVGLRGFTTVWSGHVLDQLGIHHLLSGNVVELPFKSLFIADACSGINSLYVLMGAALFLGLWFRRTWLHLIVLLGLTVLLVLIENVARIVAVAYGLQHQVDMSEGTPHTALGMALFVASLLLLVSLDRLVHFFLGRVGEWEPRRFTRRSVPHPGTLLPLLLLGISLCFLPLSGYQVMAMRNRLPQISDLVEKEINLPELGLEALPEKIGEFTRREFTTVRRVHGDPFGQASQQWVYTKGPISLRFSIDYPYQGIHDLCVCYEQTAWQTNSKQVLTASELTSLMEDPGADVAFSRLEKPLTGNGVLLFSLSDLNGNEVAVIKSIARGGQLERAAQRLDSFQNPLQSKSADEPQLTPPFIQFHQLARTPGEPTNAELDELTKFFLEARRLLKDRCLKEIQDSTGTGNP